MRHALTLLLLLAACGGGRVVEYGEGEGTLTTDGSGFASDTGDACDTCSIPIFGGEQVLFKVAYHIGTAEVKSEVSDCDVELDGSTLTVHSSTRLTLEDGVYDRSGNTYVDCLSPPLADGEYTVRFGAREKTLIVPSQPCNACDWKPYDDADLDCYQVCD